MPVGIGLLERAQADVSVGPNVASLDAVGSDTELVALLHLTHDASDPYLPFCSAVSADPGGGNTHGSEEARFVV